MKLRIVRITEWGIQLLAVLVIVLMGFDSFESRTMYVFQEGNVGMMIRTNAYQDFWHILIFGMYLITWFLFYYGIFKRYQHSLKKKVWMGLAGWILFSIIHGLVVYGFSKILQSQPVTINYMLDFTIVYELGETIFDLYFIMGVIAFLAQTTVQFLYRYQELEQADRMQSELALIRSQLRPHFFFNTLNNLYAMSLDTGNTKLADGIQNLTGMMRYSLQHSTKDLVSLSDEWNYIQKYVELQRLRFDEAKVETRLHASGNLEQVKVAPMVLINFVENAFKHGISAEKDSFIHVSLNVETHDIRFEVKNSNNPSKQDTGKSGIGTEQTVKLLNLVYKDRYTLDVNEDDSIYSVVLSLPAKL